MLGPLDDNDDGDRVESTDGDRLDGSTEGMALYLLVGAVDGATDDVADGCTDGRAVGTSERVVDGDRVG